MMRRLITVAALVGASLFAGAPAQAATHPLEYSLDGGATWLTSPPASLFDTAFRVVPGDTLTASLMIRSTRSEPTVAALNLTNANVSSALFDSALTVSGEDERGFGLAPTHLGALAPCDYVVPPHRLDLGEALEVTIAVDISPTLVQHQAEFATADFDLAIGLTDVGAPTSPNGCTIGTIVIDGFPTGPVTPTDPVTPLTPTGTIAYTGVEILPALVVATLAWGVGMCLVIVAKRRKRRLAQSAASSS